MSPQRSTPVNSQRAPSTASQSGVTPKRGGKRKGGQQEEGGGGKEEEEVQAKEREPGGSVGGRRCTDAGDSWGPCSSVEVVGHGQGPGLEGSGAAMPMWVQGCRLERQGQWAAGVGAAGGWRIRGGGAHRQTCLVWYDQVRFFKMIILIYMMVGPLCGVGCCGSGGLHLDRGQEP